MDKLFFRWIFTFSGMGGGWVGLERSPLKTKNVETHDFHSRVQSNYLNSKQCKTKQWIVQRKFKYEVKVTEMQNCPKKHLKIVRDKSDLEKNDNKLDFMRNVLLYLDKGGFSLLLLWAGVLAAFLSSLFPIWVFVFVFASREWIWALTLFFRENNSAAFES